MKNDWVTLYREGKIAGESNTLVRQLWVDAPTLSEAERILGSVAEYLHDRCVIAYEFSILSLREEREAA